MKVTLIGKPGTVVERGDTVILALEYRGTPTLPTGLPEWQVKAVPYTVYIAAKQWRKVAPVLAESPDAKVLIRGQCVFDAAVVGLAVLAQEVSVVPVKDKAEETYSKIF